MLLGIIADTHDRLPTLRWALDALTERGVTTLVHPGDVIAPFAAKLLAEFRGTVHVTYGNNDGERGGLKRVLPQIQDGPLWVGLGGRRILVHHFIDWCRDEDIAQADVVITGHTHEVTIERRGRALCINAGECCGWVSGRATCGVVDLGSLEFELIEVPT